MTLTLAELNALPEPDAADVLRACCGSAAWARRLAAQRPLASIAALLDAADAVWWSLGPADWLEALAHHPRIGERVAAADVDARSASWSSAEQRGLAGAAADVRAALAAGNREYERRFAHIYLVCAAGRDASDVLADLRARLQNDRATELRIAAAEQAKITRRRLRALVEAPAVG